MKIENWTRLNDNLLFEFVKNNIENNGYYEYLRTEYLKNDDKKCFINTIIHCFENFDCYYSLYIIMDSIEDYAQNNKLKDIDICDIINAEDFEIKEC